MEEEKRFKAGKNLEDLINRKIIESLNALVYACSGDRTMIYMNPALIARTGYDATGNKCFKVLHDLNHPCPWCVHDIVQQQRSLSTEILSPRDGRSFRATHWPLVTSDGIPAKISILRDSTDNRNISERFMEEKNFNEVLINSLPELFFLISPERRLVRWNRNLETVTGYSADELAEMNPLDFFDGKEKESITLKIDEAFRYGKSSAEASIKLKNGCRIPYFLTSSRILLNDEPNLVGTGLDISERLEVDELLRKLSGAVEQSSSSIAITDLSGRIEYVNTGFLNTTGYSLDDVIGGYMSRNMAVIPMPDPDDWQSFADAGGWPLELRNKRKNGEIFWESASVSPIKNTEEETTHYLIIRENITSRKQAERELLKSRAELVIQHEKLKNLFLQVETAKKEWENTMDCIADIVLLVDNEGRIKRYNKAFLELAEKTGQEIGKSIWHQILSSQGLQISEPFVAGKEFQHTPSGKWFVFNSYPFSDASRNEISGAVITLHNTTELKRFTSELEKAYSELKATQAKVVHQEKMASIGQLAAGVAHEINNPMGFISSNLNTLGKYLGRLGEFIALQSDLLQTLPGSPALDEIRGQRKALKVDFLLEDGVDLINESLEGAERVRTIVSNLKSFSRVDQAEHKVADINECISSTINIVWNELKYKANLVRELGDIPQIKCFPQQLNQVFMNLLVNAAQAIRDHGEITVRTWRQNDFVYASVTDTGCGMPPEVLNRIFEPFFTTKEVGKGTGLGLSITYDIIKNHKGEITVDSEPEKGTTFTVKLPIGEG